MDAIVAISWTHGSLWEGAHSANSTSAVETSAVMREKRRNELVSGRRRAMKTVEGGKTFRLSTGSV